MEILNLNGTKHTPKQVDTYPKWTEVSFGMTTNLNNKIYYLDLYTANMDLYMLTKSGYKEIESLIPIQMKDHILHHLEEYLMENLL